MPTRLLALFTLILVLTACTNVFGPEVDLSTVSAPVADANASFEEMREAWNWLVPSEDRAVLITAIGDVFLRTPDGRLKFLDTQFGTLSEIGVASPDWKHKLRADRRSEIWFRPAFVAQLRAAHGPLRPEMVYSPTAPPSLSGEYTPENYTPRLAEMHLWVIGQVQDQIKDLPPGTKITKVTIPKL